MAKWFSVLLCTALIAISNVSYAQNSRISNAWKQTGLKFSFAEAHLREQSCYPTLSQIEKKPDDEENEKGMKTNEGEVGLPTNFAIRVPHASIPYASFMACVRAANAAIAGYGGQILVPNSYLGKSKRFAKKGVNFGKVTIAQLLSLRMDQSQYASFIQSENETEANEWKDFFDQHVKGGKKPVKFEDIAEWIEDYILESERNEGKESEITAAIVNTFSKVVYGPHHEIVPTAIQNEVLSSAGVSAVSGRVFGMTGYMDNDTKRLYWFDPKPGSPAFDAAMKQGIQRGDEILGIYGIPNMPEIRPSQRLRSQQADLVKTSIIQALFTDHPQFVPQLSSIRLELKRSNGQKYSVTLSPGQMRPIDVYGRMLPGTTVGYLKVLSFMRKNVSQRIQSALADLQSKGIASLVVDLRQNGGGRHLELVETLKLFVGPDSVTGGHLCDFCETAIVNGQDGLEVDRNIVPFYANGAAMYQGPLVVLVDQQSASAAEIFAGAIQDNHRGIVVGVPTFQKGASIRCVAPYLGPNMGIQYESGCVYLSQGRDGNRDRIKRFGRSTQLRGVTPDIKVYWEGPNPSQKHVEAVDNFPREADLYFEAGDPPTADWYQPRPEYAFSVERSARDRAQTEFRQKELSSPIPDYQIIFAKWAAIAIEEIGR